MSCFKILVAFTIAQCCAHHIYLQKEFGVQKNGLPLKILTYIRAKWTPIDPKVDTKSAIQKRDLESVAIPPLPVVENPAPVIEHIEQENLDTASTFRFQRPEPSGYRVPLLRNVEPSLNTNIQESAPIQQQLAGEFYGGLPPRPNEPIRAEPIAEKDIVIPLNNPPALVQSNTVTEEAPAPLFDRTRIRQYAVYAGDVILKYLSQFFNRARINFNRFTSPPPPTPVYEN